MTPKAPSAALLRHQLTAMASEATALRDQLQKIKSRDLPAGAAQSLGKLADSINQVSARVEQIEAEHKKLSALVDIGSVVNSSLELDEVLRIVMDNIVSLTGAERGFLMLRDASGQMVTQVARHWSQESIKSTEAATSRTIVQRVIETGEAIVTTNAQDDQRFSSTASVVALNLRSILCVPLKVKNELIGVIYTDNRIRTGTFSEGERDLLDGFANQAAVAIENARLYTSLRHTLEEVTALKDLMDNVFYSITSGVITADTHDQIMLVNRAAETILGRASSDILGHPLGEVLAPVAEQIQPHLAAVRQSDQALLDLEISHVDASRGSLDWRFNVAPLKRADQEAQGLAIVVDDFTERRKLEAQRRLLQRMVSPAVLDQIDPATLQAGGKKQDVTVLFTDVRGFTAYSEKHTPEELVAVLNRYLAACAETVLDHEGTVDKFLGDAIMAFFNAPIPQADHTLRAVKTALAMRDAVARLHQELPPEAHLGFGVGIHYGDAVLGWIGSEKRLDFTAIGDSVNTAKRIQENAGKNQILISKVAFDRVKDLLEVSSVAPLVAKGKSQPIEVFEIVGIKRA